MARVTVVDDLEFWASFGLGSPLHSEPRTFEDERVAGRSGSWNLVPEPRDPRTYFRLLVGGHPFLTQLGIRYGVQDILKVLLAC